MEFRVPKTRHEPIPVRGLFFTTIKYNDLTAVFGNDKRPVSSITPTHILSAHGHCVATDDCRFANDIETHHTAHFRRPPSVPPADEERINSEFEALPSPKIIITTEKDSTRLLHTEALSDNVKQKHIRPANGNKIPARRRKKNSTKKIISYVRKIQETASWLKERMTTSPETAIILGTGLGQLATEITDSYEFSYKDIPNFPVSTVEGHAGKLIFGKLGGKDIMAMEDASTTMRGYSMKELHSPSASCTNSVSRHSSCQTHREA